jgi:hypothetical protein
MLRKTFHTAKILQKEILQPKTENLNINKFSILNNDQKALKSVSNTGFIINNISVEGPAILLNKELFMWNVPQFGVGGPNGDVEPLEKGSSYTLHRCLVRSCFSVLRLDN